MLTQGLDTGVPCREICRHAREIQSFYELALSACLVESESNAVRFA